MSEEGTAAEYRRIGQLIREGAVNEAYQAIAALLAADAHDAEAVYLLGILRAMVGQHDDALRSLRAAHEIAPDRVDFLSSLAGLLIQYGHGDEARRLVEKALESDPDQPVLLKVLARATAQSDPRAALPMLRKTVEAAPDDWEAWNELGAALTGCREFAEAKSSYLRAHQLNPEVVSATVNLGLREQADGRLDEALALFEEALKRVPNDSQVWINLGSLHLARRAPQSAAAAFARALEVRPDHTEASVLESLPRLIQGDFLGGFELYERRLALPEISGRLHPSPRWSGASDRRLRLLVKAEQGMGDVMQFARYLPMVRDRVGTLTLECVAPLQRLMRTSFGIEPVSAAPDEGFDAHVYLMSLPHLFRTSLYTVPDRVPYLRAERSQSEEWAGRLSRLAGLRVGLAWRGNRANSTDLFRSATLDLMRPLFEEAGMSFVNLVLAPADGEDVSAAPMLDVSGDLGDFADTAAVIENLDAVVSVDTSVAHLAGGLGKPTMLLLPYSGEWRWMLATDRSPWYPTMKLFRQPVPNDWPACVAAAREELRRLAG